jgi:TonB family protein
MSSLTLSGIDDKTKGRVISGIIHVLLLCLALWPFLVDREWVNENDVVVEFAETVVTAVEDNSSASSAAKEKISNLPSSNNSPKEQLSAVSEESKEIKEAHIVEAKSEIVERSSQSSEESQETTKPIHESRNFGSFFNKDGNDAASTGDRGQEDGDDALDGLGRISGKVGLGLQGRTILYAPEIVDVTQKSGKVVVDICVNSNGQVVSAAFTQKGSNTSDRHLVKKAEEAARKWKFSTSQVEKQCGVITIDFRIK